MDLKIRGRVALVTGASAGLGEAVALALAAEGVKLAVAARRTDALQSVVDASRALGASDAKAYEVDLHDAAAVESLVSRVRSDFGPVEILVANGGGPKPGAFSALSLDDWDLAYRNVLRNMLQLVDGVLPAMRENTWGRIVALTSSSVK
ncbi:MAG: SDR family NAD(P)-dependent oxidoreductase, partial [Candidatus Eremiobacteraeota bacterium]|nr:SDR family NAD(P)-dependent oxidoreductase [Candidatus Eremiobacteraeota bacterium]